MKILRNITLTGDVLFILWVVYNGIDEGSKGVGTVQAVALSSLIILLILNISLLWKQKWPNVLRKSYICGGTKYLYNKGYIMLPVQVGGLPEKISIEGNELTLKSSFHVSLVCTKLLVEQYGEKIADIEQKVLELFCAFVSKNNLSFLRYTGEFRCVAFEERKSVVALCEVSGLGEFPRFVKANLGIEIPAQPTHVTLYTLEPDAGIGLNSKDEMEMKSSPIEAPAVLARAFGLRNEGEGQGEGK